MAVLGEKKTILVTGGNTGIGRALAELLVHEHDCRVIITTRNEERGKKALEEISSENVEMIIMDATNQNSVDACAAELKKRGIENLYALVNNAGVGFENVRDLPLTDKEKTKLIIDTNFYGPIRVTNAMIDLISENGRIVNVSSGNGSAWLRAQNSKIQKLFSGTGSGVDTLTLPSLKNAVNSFIDEVSTENGLPPAPNTPGKLGYGLSKAALTALTIIYSRKYDRKKFVSLTPGFVRTNMTKSRSAPLSPVEGCRSSLKCLFAENIVSGAYYGADGLRSPIVVKRDPGYPEYEGEDNPDPKKYSKEN